MLGKNAVLFVSFLKKNKQSETHVICSFLRLVSHFYSKMMLGDRLRGVGRGVRAGQLEPITHR